jgi:hypothetical protein
MGLSSRGLWSRGVSNRAGAAGVTWPQAGWGRSEERTSRKLRLAERAADAAAARYRELRAAASSGGEGSAPRGPMPTWQQLLLLVLGGGLLAGLLMMWLLAAAYVGPAAMLVLPAVGGLVAAFIALRRRHRPPPKVRRPLVADLVRATQELHDAEAALQRARGKRGGA